MTCFDFDRFVWVVSLLLHLRLTNTFQSHLLRLVCRQGFVKKSRIQRRFFSPWAGREKVTCCFLIIGLLQLRPNSCFFSPRLSCFSNPSPSRESNTTVLSRQSDGVGFCSVCINHRKTNKSVNYMRRLPCSDCWPRAINPFCSFPWCCVIGVQHIWNIFGQGAWSMPSVDASNVEKSKLERTIL